MDWIGCPSRKSTNVISIHIFTMQLFCFAPPSFTGSSVRKLPFLTSCALQVFSWLYPSIFLYFFYFYFCKPFFISNFLRVASIFLVISLNTQYFFVLFVFFYVYVYKPFIFSYFMRVASIFLVISPNTQYFFVFFILFL